MISTLTHGYKLQFRCRTPAFGQIKMTIIRDLAKAHALNQELSALLDKGAIEPEDPLSPRGFYSILFGTGLQTFYHIASPPPGEFHPEVVLNMWDVFGRAEADLFAIEESTHCPLWFFLTEEASQPSGPGCSRPQLARWSSLHLSTDPRVSATCN